MPQVTIIDTFPAFQAFWTAVRHLQVDAQIESWVSNYMSQWPNLLKIQQDDYASQNEDWRQIAREHVFPHLGDRLPAMELAHSHLLEVCEPVCARARQVLGFESGVIAVIYVGIGCGAGWATRYQRAPAILFGLENIAECGWTLPPVLAGLVAHEIGHLVHSHWRAKAGKPEGAGPWWDLYTEGFAQRCEHTILGKEMWHMRSGYNDDDWLDWCRDHLPWLSAEFLRRVDAGEPVRPFFGSWFELRGRKQCGYFLGHELIKELEGCMDLREIALLEDVETRFRNLVERGAASKAQ